MDSITYLSHILHHTHTNYTITGDLPFSSSSTDDMQPYPHTDSSDPKYQEQSATPPDDWKTNTSYSKPLVDWQMLEDEMIPLVEEIPTINGKTVHLVAGWKPWEASTQADFILVLNVLRYCPTTVLNFCGDGRGGHYSPMAAMFSNGYLRSATWRLLQVMFHEHFWKMGKMNSTLVVIGYRGSVHDLYTPENYNRVVEIYSDYWKKVLELVDRVAFWSVG